MGVWESGIIILSITSVAVAADTPKTAFDWNERGVAAAARGDAAEAEKDYNAALAIWRALGPDFQPHAATTLYNLGQALLGEGRWTDSIPVFEESLNLGRRTLGIRNSRTLNTLNALGRAYMVTGNFDQAAACFLEALPIERELFPNGLELAQTLGSLAILRTREDRTDEALPLGDEALSIAIRSLGDDAADTGTMYAIVAEIHQRARRPERAIPLFRKARAIYDRTLQPNDLRYSSLLTSEALAFADDGKLRAAEKEMQHAIDLLTPHASEYGFALAIAETDFGLIRMAEKRYVDADAYLRSALEREERYSTGPAGDRLQTLKLLAQLRDKQHRYAESTALKQRIAAMQTTYR